MKIRIKEREKQGSGLEEGRKGDNYFNNIVKELSIEDTAKNKEIMRISSDKGHPTDCFGRISVRKTSNRLKFSVWEMSSRAFLIKID